VLFRSIHATVVNSCTRTLKIIHDHLLFILNVASDDQTLMHADLFTPFPFDLSSSSIILLAVAMAAAAAAFTPFVTPLVTPFVVVPFL
jgi:hypothetical protein